MATLKDLAPGETRWIERGIFAAGRRRVRFATAYVHEGKRVQEMVGSTMTLARKALSVRRSEIVQGASEISGGSAIGFCSQKDRTDEAAERLAKTFLRRYRPRLLTRATCRYGASPDEDEYKPAGVMRRS